MQDRASQTTMMFTIVGVCMFVLVLAQVYTLLVKVGQLVDVAAQQLNRVVKATETTMQTVASASRERRDFVMRQDRCDMTPKPKSV